MNHSLGQPPPRCPYRLSALALVVMVSACRPPPPTPPPEPAPPLPGPILRMEPVAGDTAEAVFAMDPVTLGTTLVYRARSPSPTQSLVVPGSSPQRRAVRLDRGSLSGPLTVDLRRGFSIALRVRIDGQGDLLGSAGASNGMIVAVGNGYSDGFRIQADTPRRRLTFSIGRPAAPYSVSVVSPPVEFGRWLDIVATWDGHVMRLYVDGWLVAERAMTASYTVPARNILTIGYANAGVGSLNMAFERAELFTQALSPSACLRLLVPDVVPTAEFVELWDSLAVAARRSKATEEELAQLDALRSAADALPITFRLAARRLEAELASQHRNTARAADAYLDLCDHASAPSGWSDGAREELRRFLREGATAGWSPALLDRLAGS